MSKTYASVMCPANAWRVILGRLQEAGYNHVLVKEDTISMEGLALRREPEETEICPDDAGTMANQVIAKYVSNASKTHSTVLEAFCAAMVQAGANPDTHELQMKQDGLDTTYRLAPRGAPWA